METNIDSLPMQNADVDIIVCVIVYAEEKALIKTKLCLFKSKQSVFGSV